MTDDISTENIVKRLRELGMVPKEVVEAYLKDLTAKQKEVFVTRGEFEALKKAPFKEMLNGLDAAAAEGVQAKIGPLAIEKAVDSAMQKTFGKVDDEVRKQFSLQLVGALNEIYGTNYQTVEDAFAKSKKTRKTQTALAVGLAFSSALALGVAGYAFKRTNEGAVGVAKRAETSANNALVAGEKTRKELYSLKEETNHSQTREKADRDKQMGELEQRVTGQITNKLDKTEWGARAADLEKGIADVQAAYKQIDALLQGEITKDASREKAYGQYKTLVESSKKEIDGLRLRITELQTGFSTKEYTDTEIGKMKTEYDSMKKDLRQKYDGLLGVIKKMQNYSGESWSGEAEKTPKNK